MPSCTESKAKDRARDPRGDVSGERAPGSPSVLICSVRPSSEHVMHSGVPALSSAGRTRTATRTVVPPPFAEGIGIGTPRESKEEAGGAELVSWSLM